MDRREAERLVRAIREANGAGEPAALATIVRVRGSAYRREGTHMLVRRDRSYECALSGGCLEPAVAEAAVRVIQTGEPVVIAYDLADDSLWGLGVGCTGAVDIRIEPVVGGRVADEWWRVLERGDSGVLVTPLSGVSGRIAVVDAETVGALSDPSVQALAVRRARERLAAALPFSGAEQVGDAELFFEVATAPPQLVIFGAGHDAEPVVRHGWALGFSVTVVDVRETFLTHDRFPDATLTLAHFSEFHERVRLVPGCFVLVMNHHLERDRESLRFALASDAAYIGVLGPRQRYEKLLAELREGEVEPSTALLSRVHSPVGLALGAETPEEVALSIVAEILAVRHGFEGGFLAGRSRSLHQADATRLFARS